MGDLKKPPSKKTAAAHNFLLSSYLHKINVWKDNKMNNKCCVQIHLGSGTLASEFKPRLEMKGQKQFLCLDHIVSPAFLNNEIFEATAGDLIQDEEERTLMCHSHSGKVKAMREKYTRDTLGNEEDEEDKPVAAFMEIELPFVCDDIFDDSLVPYPNTGYNFRSLELDVDVDDFDEIELIDVMDADKQNEISENEMDVIFIFSIVLVNKVKNIVSGKTTTKKKALRGKKFSRKANRG